VAGAGAVSQPSYSINSDTNTGFYSTGDDVFNLAVGGARKVVMASSIFGFDVAHTVGWYSAGFAGFDTAMGRFGINTQYFGTANSGNGSIVASNHVATGDFVASTNGIIFPKVAVSASASLAFAGAQLLSDGTNMLVVLQNAGGARTTNKLSMVAWP